MDLSHNFPSLCFELRIIQAKNNEHIKSSGNSLFARFYLPTGNNKIQLNTKKVSSKSINPFWNESFNLECSCPQEFLETLEQESMVLELRQRKNRIWGSNLIGRGEIPWKKILDSSNMMLKEWVKMDLVNGNDDDILKVPEVQVEIKIRVRSMEKEENSLNKCGFKHDHDLHPWLSAEDYDIFTLGAALEAF
ncbi:hypothetical protein Lal_00003503 [Lupinus albus]|uniref:Putative C2 domain-containing protein n=1 Tax=Lupinus albus TaxID=3870 RepID=A0A6A5MB01_LUPAL|nr:putative C2 domain-containing protein [Lupinus albus]KAF1870297.1 hypothetical protein Lal_00003503 [Lupinus albus]